MGKRGTIFHAGEQLLQPGGLSLGEDFDTVIEAVTNPAGKMQRLGLLLHEVAEAHALHRTAYENVYTLVIWHFKVFMTGTVY